MSGITLPGRHPNDFHPVIVVGEAYKVLDLSAGYDPAAISLDPPSIGRYNEKRRNMYTAGLFNGERNIHMGLDFWVPPGTPVHAFADGRVLCYRVNDRAGDYGPTIVTEHRLTGIPEGNADEIVLYALFGHLSRTSLDNIGEGKSLKRGDVFAFVGNEHENGGWVPHLHFQLSLVRPEEPDMPGVVSEADRAKALQTYPDPQLVTGRFY